MLTAAWEGDETQEDLLSALKVIGARNMSQEANLSVGWEDSRGCSSQRMPPSAPTSRSTRLWMALTASTL